MSIVGIIAVSILILIGIGGIALGIYMFDDGGAPAIVLGIILLLISSLTIVYIVNNNTETTEKVIGKGTIVTKVDFDYFNGGKDNSNEIKYFIEVESGDKIIIDKSEWDKIKDEYTYIPSKVDIIKEDSYENRYFRLQKFNS